MSNCVNSRYLAKVAVRQGTLQSRLYKYVWVIELGDCVYGHNGATNVVVVVGWRRGIARPA